MDVIAKIGKKRGARKKPQLALPTEALESTTWVESFAGLTAVPTTDLRKDSSSIISRVEFGGEEIVLTRHGKPAAALVSLAALKAIRDLEDTADRAAVAAAKRDIKKHGTVSFEDVKRRLDL